MIKKILNKIGRFSNLDNKIHAVEERNKKLLSEIEATRVLVGKHLSNEVKKCGVLKHIGDAEFKVFSQFGDDGIIQYLINYLDITDSFFIEFGVEDYRESVTRFLLLNNNWAGLVMDGSIENIDYIKNDNIYVMHQLSAVHAFVDTENINTIISSENITGDVGLLHIDIDGNDYWIWQALKVVAPILVIVEYNAVFGDNRSITVPYRKDFRRTNAHYSNLYYGASLSALCRLANEKGYNFIGCSTSGNNAYFVRKDKSKDLPNLSAKQGFINSNFRESRDALGNLTYLSGENRLSLIQGLPVYDVEKGVLEQL